jgi:hypothetical protein
MNLNSRRSVLGLLGLTGAAAVAVNTEVMADPEIVAYPGLPGLHKRGLHAQLAMAEALETLARNIREGKCACTSMDTSSSFKPNEWIEHEIKIKIEILQETA